MRTESEATAFRIGLSGPLRASKTCKGACTGQWARVLSSPLTAARSCSCMQGVARLQLPTVRNFGLQHEIGPFNRASTFELDCGFVFWQLIYVGTRINSSEEHEIE